MILVCVTDQESCDRLIYTGHRLAQKWNETLEVITVRPRRMGVCDGRHQCWLASPELEYLSDVSNSVDADLNFVFHDDPVRAISEHINRYHPVCVVTGVGPDGMVGDFHERLFEGSPDTQFCAVDKAGKLMNCGRHAPILSERSM